MNSKRTFQQTHLINKLILFNATFFNIVFQKYFFSGNPSRLWQSSGWPSRPLSVAVVLLQVHFIRQQKFIMDINIDITNCIPNIRSSSERLSKWPVFASINNIRNRNNNRKQRRYRRTNRNWFFRGTSKSHKRDMTSLKPVKTKKKQKNS